MSHWIVTPVVLPAMLAAIIVLLCRHHPVLQRIFALAGSGALLAVAIGLFVQASGGTITLYQLGDWQAPFGIVLVADRLSTLLVLLTAVLSIFVLLHAIGTGWDQRGRHFHALFQFQLMGVMGAFLTGDLFNLFVFFEVLLIASYGLMIHSGGTKRTQAGTQYVLYNLLGSTLFLFALGTLYAETGTLNMADLANRVAQIAPENSAGIRTAAVLLVIVFAIKAAIAPVHFWLPASYAEAPGPVAALFAIMTKVGAYAIIRVYTLVFPPELELTQGLLEMWLLPLALIGLAVGMIGVLGAVRLDRMVTFAVIGSMGMLTAAVALFTAEGISAALYYIVHSTLATAALFLIVDLVEEHRGSRGAELSTAPPIPGNSILAGMFFVAAIAMAGLPPLSGFLGKLLILDAAFDSPLVVWTWAVILGTSLVSVVGFSRAGSTVFWKAAEWEERMEAASDDPATQMDNVATTPEAPARPQPILPLVTIGGLIGLIVLYTIFSGPVSRTMTATAEQLFSPEPYISTVLDTPGKEIDYHGDYEEDGDGGEDHADEDQGAGSGDHGAAAETDGDTAEEAH
ncbi:monovalent cation/H+ antiporter subunit D [Roseivivax sediminis]|uniref:Multisubunit potassium/proton antiporter, PhaD subunit n=1 Tax=Roseivivax sediminis TaxID=936889 RepID=A0A1I1VYD8_9RHOB|nr:monovalent cation/H+ antiporter subunit D [Roseivivax sediminis]SFD88106.1 multisubunit potassium/proton antiporter, PhaD subunit [Roseivivax sediminis]